MKKNEKVEQLLADSKMALFNFENEKALSLAGEAQKIQPENPEVYKCAGNAYMSMEKYEDAVRNYKTAMKWDPQNGSRYYDLGYAQVALKKMPEAIKNLAKAEELGCPPDNLTQLYYLLGIICFDLGRYDDALINLNKAEQIIGVDVEILQRKAVLYGLKGELRNGLLISNEIKMISPSDYKGYQIAFRLLIEAEKLKEAQTELTKAKEYAIPCMEYYFDWVTLHLELYKKDHKEDHFTEALEMLSEALEKVKPTLTSAMECYINAAELHLQLEKPDDAINCLNAAQAPAYAFNHGFEIVTNPFEPIELSGDDILQMREEERENIIEEYGDYGIEELAESAEPDEEGRRSYLTDTELTDIAAQAVDSSLSPKLNEEEHLTVTQENTDQINRLYVGAYTLKNEFDKVMEYARKLQSSTAMPSVYIGKYSEANALKKLGREEAGKKYEELIRFFRNESIKDPTDLSAITFRIQCYIDIGEYDEAEKICSLLTKELRNGLMEKIEAARKGEGKE